MARTILDDVSLLVQLYEESIDPLTGQGSCEYVRQRLGEAGILTRWTGKPPSRQAVRYALMRDPKGKELLNRTAKNKWMNSKRYG